MIREFQKNKNVVSKDEIFGMMQNSCTMGHLDTILNKMRGDGQISDAHDSNHFYLVN